MASALRVLLLLLTIGWCHDAAAEVLVRWDQDEIPSPQSLGISSVVIPASRPAAVRSALARGYRVYVEIESAELAGFERAEGVAGAVVRGPVPPAQLAALEQKMRPAGVRVVEERGKWPHIRTNWVTRNKDVLQVTSRSSQPWIENNEALIRIAAAPGGAPRVLLSYPWKPVTVADLDQGPRVENYLVAIAEAGSFGADLVLPLHERFQRSLILGRPDARAEWNELRRYIGFYSWDVPIGYTPVANVGVVAADPMRSFELMNLLGRHNLPFTPIDPARLTAPPAGLDLLIVLDAVQGTALQQVTAFAANGGTVLWAAAGGTPAAPPERLPWRSDPNPVTGEARVTYASGRGRVIEWQAPLSNPNTFALDMRQVLGPERRVIDIWNGITVLTAPYAAPAGGEVVVSALNYAAQPLPVQLRVRGIFSQVQYESPEEAAALLPFQHRNGFTEFVLPALRIGGRVFLTPLP